MSVEQGNLQTAGVPPGRRMCLSGEQGAGVFRERLEAIGAQLSDPQYQPFLVCRRIAGLMAQVVQRICSLGSTAEDQFVLSGRGKQVKVLRQLIKQVIDEQRLRKQDDVLDWEGEKFQFVLPNLYRHFQQAMTEGGVDEFQRPMVWRNFRDLATLNEERIRREIAKLGR